MVGGEERTYLRGHCHVAGIAHRFYALASTPYSSQSWVGQPFAQMANGGHICAPSFFEAHSLHLPSSWTAPFLFTPPLRPPPSSSLRPLSSPPPSTLQVNPPTPVYRHCRPVRPLSSPLPSALQVNPPPQFTGTVVHYYINICAVEEPSKEKGVCVVVRGGVLERRGAEQSVA